MTSRFAWGGLVAPMVLLITACGGGSSGSAPRPVEYDVALAGSNVTLDPAAATVAVASSDTLAVTVTPDAGHELDEAGGTCPAGSWSGAVYTTGAITAACSLLFSAHVVHAVTPSGTNATVTPGTVQTVLPGATVALTVTPDAGYGVPLDTNPGGTCPAGTWTTPFLYTTGAVTADCTVTFQAQPTTTLATSVSALGLQAGGTARVITITNTGANTAYRVFPYINAVAPLPTMPPGTALGGEDCGDLAAAASCQVSVHPGATPTHPAGDGDALPFRIVVYSDTASALDVDVSVLVPGSVYQGGYLFALDDTTPASGSIGGKVVSLEDQAPDFAAVAFEPMAHDIAGIDEQSATPGDACDGATDGACNTAQIVAANPLEDVLDYAAGRCSLAIDGYTDWYLPAICEIGYDNAEAGSGCGTALAPRMDNIRQLFDSGAVTTIGDAGMPLWSSTAVSSSPQIMAWTSQPQATVGWHQEPTTKSMLQVVRCVRAVTP